MKSVLLAIFALMGMATYASEAKVDVLELTDVFTNDELILKEKLESNENLLKEKIIEINNQVAFEYYYTMDWLYEETPFIYKLEVLV